MGNYKQLKAQVHTFELIGGTGKGKTATAIVPASEKAREILKKCVGRTNSTLTDRLLVYTTEYEDRIVVAVKKKDSIISRDLFTETIVKALAEVVRLCAKSKNMSAKEEKEKLKECLEKEIGTKDNTKAGFSFLTEEQQADFKNNVVQLYSESNLHEDNNKIYNKTKNNMHDAEVKETSAKFRYALETEVRSNLEQKGADFLVEFWKIWENINEKLKKVFFQYFDTKHLSNDGYYFKELFLDEPDEEFVDAMFTSNNIQGGERLSLEVLCEEIVLYVPMHKSIAGVIDNLVENRNVFYDRQGNTTFGMLDTRGLFHTNRNEDENADYLSEHAYRHDIDALMLMMPLSGDANEKKAYGLYHNMISKFNRQIPVFLLHNKLDLFVYELNEKDFDDPLLFDTKSLKELTPEEIDKRITEKENKLSVKLKEAQSELRKDLNIHSVSYYLRRSHDFNSIIAEKYHVYKAFEKVFSDVSGYLAKNATKFVLKANEGEDVEPSIDETNFTIVLDKHIEKYASSTKQFGKGLTNVKENSNITPHGNSYNALRRRLRLGYGYTSNIDESYFYNCNSFSVTFPANLRNFVSDELLEDLIGSALTIDGAKFSSEEDKNNFKSAVQRYINRLDFVSILLYDYAIQEAEKTAFSFRSKFQNFLNKSDTFFNTEYIDQARYAEALKTMILDVANRMLNLYTIIK